MPVSTQTRQRFECKFTKSDGCWLWAAGVNHKGYGVFRLGRESRAHRVAWIIYKGDILNNLHVLHSCDNRRCVNPDHLFLGTNQDNVDDKVRKGRSYKAKGEDNANSKLTDNDVIEIIRRWGLGRGERGIGSSPAKEFGVSKSLISLIVNRKRR